MLREETEQGKGDGSENYEKGVLCRPHWEGELEQTHWKEVAIYWKSIPSQHKGLEVAYAWYS